MSTNTVETRISGASHQQQSRLRKGLDALYAWSGYAAAACIVLILLATIAQVVTRYLGIVFSGLSSYAGYFMAASTFLGLAHALNSGSHIRIETIAKLLGPRRVVLDVIAFGIGGAVASWFAFYACKMVYWSVQLNDISTELDATPLWIPQSTMAIGTVLFAVAILDNFVTLLLTGKHRIQHTTEVL